MDVKCCLKKWNLCNLTFFKASAFTILWILFFYSNSVYPLLPIWDSSQRIKRRKKSTTNKQKQITTRKYPNQSTLLLLPWELWSCWWPSLNATPNFWCAQLWVSWPTNRSQSKSWTGCICLLCLEDCCWNLLSASKNIAEGSLTKGIVFLSPTFKFWA